MTDFRSGSKVHVGSSPDGCVLDEAMAARWISLRWYIYAGRVLGGVEISKAGRRTVVAD
jgi:hypothetical protein